MLLYYIIPAASARPQRFTVNWWQYRILLNGVSGSAPCVYAFIITVYAFTMMRLWGGLTFRNCTLSFPRGCQLLLLLGCYFWGVILAACWTLKQLNCQGRTADRFTHHGSDASDSSTRARKLETGECWVWSFNYAILKYNFFNIQTLLLVKMKEKKLLKIQPLPKVLQWTWREESTQNTTWQPLPKSAACASYKIKATT